MSDHRAAPSSAEVMLSVAYYTAASSIMLVANKVAITCFPVPAMVFSTQIFVTVLYIQVLKAVGRVPIDDITWENVKSFAPYACSFVCSIYSNGKVLQHANVETVITFRACSPLCVCVLDWLLLGRELPDSRSLLSLVGVLIGATGYVCSDSEFQLKGLGAYAWVSVYLLFIVFEMTYGKIILSKVSFKAPVWGSVLYTNALALVPITLVGLGSGEVDQLGSLKPTTMGICALVFCCTAGIAISWAGWNCRDKVSATTYTLVGVACKFISVLLNVLIWDKHASPAGIMWLGVCLVASSVYRQAPMRPRQKPSENSDQQVELEGLTVGKATAEADPAD